ncbi:Mitogen-activated protein kinase kinase kinase [Trema orientale]|uniref:Receptor-like serine/threonine-protein kinase n=1 Tax=Trema orientale TaxID=63057 RepID=A0A2P5CM78_TREOI|nr:Mitogen-activated protein kinase kinase kinase [Trema orientale]
MRASNSKAFSFLSLIFLAFFSCVSHASDTLKPGEILYSYETLVSANGVFELGFFSSGDSSNEYLGIWFKNDKNKKAVWVAQREDPLPASSGSLSLTYGNLVMCNNRTSDRTILNSDAPATSNDTIARLLDSGNFVLIQGETTIWQSFEHPTDTFLPGMKLGVFNIGASQRKIQFLLSWFSPYDPSKGSFSLGLDIENRTRFNIWWGDYAYQEIGIWDGKQFRLFFESSSNNHNFSFASTKEETYLTFTNKESNVFSWFVMAPNGVINEYRMKDQKISMVNHSLCDGTQERNASGCLIIPLVCENGDDFSEITGLMPSSMVIRRATSIGLSGCELICRSNCSCVAYAYSDGHRAVCELYYGTKHDLHQMIGKGNQAILLRGHRKSDQNRNRNRLILITVTVIALILLILTILFSCLWRKYRFLGPEWNKDGMKGSMRLLLSQFSNENHVKENVIGFNRKKNHNFFPLKFSCIVEATENFSAANKLGEGGFGRVYKGKLFGQDIAVKRLSKNSGQGLMEFRNEVMLISCIQHRNLVKLLGFCIHRDERILIYEYMPNKSLDSIIFDPTKRPLLDWRKRKNIIEGIAQGLLYLHKYSRLRIIHRDLKTSNILLDSYMNPKISDFGLARAMPENDHRAKTKKIAGTYGYLSPEYALHGLFSTKSDVFSFGVILFEVISGRKNSIFCESDCSNLLGHAWNLWTTGRCMELMDLTLAASCPMTDLMLYIQVGLLCVQETPEDRPNMSDVISMLSNEGASLPMPKQPAFSTHLMTGVETPSRRMQYPSQNLVSFSGFVAR